MPGDWPCPAELLAGGENQVPGSRSGRCQQLPRHQGGSRASQCCSAEGWDLGVLLGGGGVEDGDL